MVPADDDFDRRVRDATLAAMAELAAGAGHEINNPVATIVGRAQQLLAGESDPGRRRALATIASQALRIRDMIGDLMLFARPPEPAPIVVDLTEIAREVAAPFAADLHVSNVSLRVDAESPVSAFVDPTQIAVALTALIENARNAVASGGRITVEAAYEDDRPTLRVRDDGGHWTDIDREHAFNPFYSGRQAGRGLGFGLPKAWRIVTFAGGTIQLDSSPGETIVTITLPASGADRDSA